MTTIPPFMIDTDVIVRAVKSVAKVQEPNDTDATRHTDGTARDLLMRLDMIRVAAHTAFELQWVRAPSDKVMETLTPRFKIESFNAEAQETAARIAKTCIDAKAFCSKCWTHQPANKCGACGANGSRWRKMNDVYIAATVLHAEEVGVFYTFNTTHFAHYLAGSHVQVREPEDHDLLTRYSHGLPLPAGSVGAVGEPSKRKKKR